MMLLLSGGASTAAPARDMRIKLLRTLGRFPTNRSSSCSAASDGCRAAAGAGASVGIRLAATAWRSSRSAASRCVSAVSTRVGLRLSDGIWMMWMEPSSSTTPCTMCVPYCNLVLLRTAAS